jgi:restriction system protein
MDRPAAARCPQRSGERFGWTAGTVNPRHIYGSYLFINTFLLLAPDAQGFTRVTPDGNAFLSNDPQVLRKLDEEEGLPQLLSILAAHSPAKRGDLLDEWSEFLLENSNYGTVSTFKDTLRRRLLNLVERGYVAREGNTYTITDKGLRMQPPQGQKRFSAHISQSSAPSRITTTLKPMNCVGAWRR